MEHKKTNQPHAETVMKLTLVLDRLRSAYNTGNIFRIAEAAGAEIFACGYTPAPGHPKLAKTAMGADAMVRCRHAGTAAEAITALRAEGCRQVLAAEPGEGAVPAWEYKYEFPLALVLGNEALGISEDALALCDARVELPMLGAKASINVGNAAAAIVCAIAASAETRRLKE